MTSQPLRRSSRKRTEIRAALEGQDRFISAQALHQLMTASGSDVGLATVYRTLQLLLDDGDVDAVRDDAGEMMYRLCEKESHHHHLVCRMCGFTVEVAGPQIEAWAHEVAEANGFADVNHTVELFGICAACQAKLAAAGEHA